MKALRILSIAFGVLIALLAAGIATLYVLFDGEKIKTRLVDVVMTQTQRKLDISGPLELSVWPDVSIKLDHLTLSEPGDKTEFLALNSARVAVAVMPLLSKQVKVQRIEIDGLKAMLVKHKDGTLNIADLTGGTTDKGAAAKAEPKGDTGAVPPAPLQLDVAGIRIANASLTWRDEKSGTTTALSNLDLSSGRVQADSGKQTLEVDALLMAAKGKTGTDNFELKLDAPKLSLSPERSVSKTLSLATNLNGSGRQLMANLVLSGLDGNLKALKIGGLALDVDAKSGETAVKAHLDSPVRSDLAAQTLALEKLAGSIDLVSPQIPMKQLKLPLSGSLSADMAKQSLALDLGTRFDESKIALKLNVTKFSPLALGFNLDIDTLNIDKYLPPKKDQAKTSTPGNEAPESKLDFSALIGLDVIGALHVGALQVSRLKSSNINAKLKIAGGRLDIAPLTLSLYGGNANGNLWLNANGNQLGVKQDLAGVNINPLMKDLADKDLLEGRGNVALDVSSHGDTVSAMKKALDGTAGLSLKDGAIKGINLAQSLRDIKSKLGAKQDSTQQAKAGDKTDFSELSATMRIAKGVAHNDDLAMKSPFLRLGGAGDIDIGLGQMNYLAKASVVASSAGQGGDNLDQLKGLTIPVRITGPFDALSYKLELGDLVSEMAKAKLDEKKDEIKAKAEGQLKGKLKGFFSK